MEHYAPHPRASFEGWYSKFGLPSGAHLIVIICSVPKAPTLPPHMLSITYVPASNSNGHGNIWQREFWVQDIQRVVLEHRKHAFELRIPDFGAMRCDAQGKSEWDIRSPGGEFELKATAMDQVPWNKGARATPEGWYIYLPLPLHWHVHSLGSKCTVMLNIPSMDSQLQPEDKKCIATVHQEKNWANSFPSSHVWIQARSESSNFNGESNGPTTASSPTITPAVPTPCTLCLAGGRILGMTAFIIGYRSPSLSLDFLPPFALSFGSLSPSMSVDVDWENRTFSLSVQSFTQKLVIKAHAPRESFFGLAAPFAEGHRRDFCAESFRARVDVEVWERGWLWWLMAWEGRQWRLVKKERFENASLEFGGEYYGDRGERKEKWGKAGSLSGLRVGGTMLETKYLEAVSEHIAAYNF